jgi:hypothetical protein
MSFKWFELYITRVSNGLFPTMFELRFVWFLLNLSSILVVYCMFRTLNESITAWLELCIAWFLPGFSSKQADSHVIRVLHGSNSMFRASNYPDFRTFRALHDSRSESLECQHQLTSSHEHSQSALSMKHTLSSQPRQMMNCGLSSMLPKVVSLLWSIPVLRNITGLPSSITTTCREGLGFTCRYQLSLHKHSIMKDIQWWRRFNDEEDSMMKKIQWWRRFNDEEDSMMKKSQWWRKYNDEEHPMMKKISVKNIQW